MLFYFRFVGDLLGDDAPSKAQKFAEVYDANIAYVQEKTANIPEAKRVKVLNLRTDGNGYTTVDGKDISAYYAQVAGGDFVSGDFEKQETTGSTVNAEQIITWAPEVIFTMGQSSKEQIMNDPSLKTVPAVANDKVFVEPSGTYPWSVRSAEGALMPFFLGKIMYPDLFQDLSLEDKIKEFYKEMYDYDLNDEEVATILRGEE